MSRQALEKTRMLFRVPEDPLELAMYAQGLNGQRPKKLSVPSKGAPAPLKRR
jgi:hypothetical protein